MMHAKSNSNTTEYPHHPADYTLTATQQAALELYDKGLNVFPQPIAKKGGYPWKRLQYTRLDRDDYVYGIRTLFAGNTNIAVMCGRTSENLFVIDCEDMDVMRDHARQMRRRGIPLWAVKTARGGHLYLRAREGEVHNIPSGTLPSAEIKGGRGYVLTAPSVHPSGEVYEWLAREGEKPPLVSVRDIDWLTDLSGSRVWLDVTPPPRKTLPQWSLKLGVTSPLSPLSQQTLDYLRSGHLIPEGNRNNRLFAAACDLYGNDYSEDEASRLLFDIATASGLPPAEVQTTIRSAYSQPRGAAREYYNTAPKPQPTNRHSLWQYALIYILSQNWQGRGKSSERALLLALVERARISANENGVFRGSIRELAMLARIGTATLQKALMRMEHYDTPVIFKAGTDRLSGSTLWVFSDAMIAQGRKLAEQLQAAPAHWMPFFHAMLTSDATERGGLGPNGMYLYQFMLAQRAPMMPSALAEAAGMTVNQVNYGLRKLREYGLVQREESGWQAVRVKPEDLEDQMPTKGRAAARRRRFERERSLYASRRLFKARHDSEGERFQKAAWVTIRWYHYWEERIKGDVLLRQALDLGGLIRRMIRVPPPRGDTTGPV